MTQIEMMSIITLLVFLAAVSITFCIYELKRQFKEKKSAKIAKIIIEKTIAKDTSSRSKLLQAPDAVYKSLTILPKNEIIYNNENAIEMNEYNKQMSIGRDIIDMEDIAYGLYHNNKVNPVTPVTKLAKATMCIHIARVGLTGCSDREVEEMATNLMFRSDKSIIELYNRVQNP